MTGQAAAIRPDLQRIADLIDPDSRVLDVGCSDGELLDHLWRTKNVDGRGIELSQDGVHASVKRGLSVIQGDADTDLDDFPDASFTYAVLSQTIQAMHDPKRVLDNLVRIAEHAIVSLPNFAYWRMRLSLLWNGRMPVTKTLPYQWYDTPNIHFCTILDFVGLCREMDITIDRAMVVRRNGSVSETRMGRSANWLGEQGIFLLRRTS
jgi:methionine biosynthesis protein MetW